MARRQSQPPIQGTVITLRGEKVAKVLQFASMRDDIYAWLDDSERPGLWDMGMEDAETLWVVFSDKNVAFEFKMRWL